MQRRFWFILGGLGLLVLGGAAFWYSQSKKVAVAPLPVETVVEEQPESVKTVLEAVPPLPDFATELEATLQAVSLNEATALKVPQEYLNALNEALANTIPLMRDPTSNTCQVIHEFSQRVRNLGPFSSVRKSISEEQVQETRDIYDAAQTDASEQYYQTWSDWSIRLREAVATDKASKQKAVEKWQQKFGDATDEYQSEVETVMGALRNQADRQLISLREQLLVADTDMQLDIFEGECQGPPALDNSSRGSFVRALMGVQSNIQVALARVVKVEKEVLALPATLTPALNPKLRQETLDLKLSFETLQNTLAK